MKHFLAFLALVAIAASGGCDAAWDLRPEGWTEIEKGVAWRGEFGRLEIVADSLGALADSTVAFLSMRLINRGDEAIAVEGVDLNTPKDSYEWHALLKHPYYTVHPGQDLELQPHWDFRKSPCRTVRRVLGERCKVILRLRMGDKPKAIEIAFSRQ